MGDPGDCKSESFVVWVLIAGGEAVVEDEECEDFTALEVVAAVVVVRDAVVKSTGSVVPA